MFHQAASATDDPVRQSPYFLSGGERTCNFPLLDDQQRIAECGLELTALLLRKNADYGGSAWQAPLLAPGMTPREAIRWPLLTRISLAAFNCELTPGSVTLLVSQCEPYD
jgi:hypothetical protein